MSSSAVALILVAVVHESPPSEIAKLPSVLKACSTFDISDSIFFSPCAFCVVPLLPLYNTALGITTLPALSDRRDHL